MIKPPRALLDSTLAAILTVSAGLKLFGGPATGSLLPEWAHYSIIPLELLIAATLFSRLRQTACASAIALFAVGGILGLLNRSVPCGCLGAGIHVDWRVHVAAAAAFGILATWCLSLRAPSTTGHRTS